MDKKIIIANWKSNKNTAQAEEFIRLFSENINRLNLDNKQIILAPSYSLLYTCKTLIDKYNLPVSLCAQDVSSFPEGAYTGAVNAKQIKEFADYTIIGHSERRDYFSESDDVLFKKVNEAKDNDLKIIYCIQNENQKIPSGVAMVAFEPPTAIGTNNPDDPKHIEEVFSQVSKSYSGKILYGGSIKADNVRNYIHIASCSGLLVGGASLEADSFIDLIKEW